MLVDCRQKLTCELQSTYDSLRCDGQCQAKTEAGAGRGWLTNSTSDPATLPEALK